MNRAERRRQGKKAKKAAKNSKPEQATNRSAGQQALAIKQSLQLAVQHHNSGELAKAEGIYQQILQTDPNQPDALHLLGVIYSQVGKHDVSVEFITKALAIEPNLAEAHSNLGLALRELGKLDEAVASYHKVLGLKPDFAEAHSNLGLALMDLGKLDEAVASYHKALAINPDYAQGARQPWACAPGLGRAGGCLRKSTALHCPQPPERSVLERVGGVFGSSSDHSCR